MPKRILSKIFLVLGYRKEYFHILIKVFFALIFIMIAFEWTKDIIFPNIKLFWSHFITVIFTAVNGTIISYLVLANLDYLNFRIKRKYESSKKLEDALRDSEERYKLIFNNSVECLVIFDIETGKIVDFNTLSHESLSFTVNEFLEFNIEKFQKLVPSLQINQLIDKNNNSKQPPIQTEIITKTGIKRNIIFKSSIFNIRDNSFLIIIWRDATEAIQDHKNLIETNKMLSTLLDTLPLPVFYKDKEGKYIGCNKSFIDFLGISKEKIIGKSVFELGIPQDIAKKYFEKDNELFNNPGKQEYKWKIKTQNSGIRDVIFYKSTFTDFYGRISGLIGIIVDITEQNAIQEKNDKIRHSIIKQNRALFKWMNPEFIYCENQADAFKNIIETISRVLDIERVGIWIFNESSSLLYCAHMFTRKEGWQTVKHELSVNSFCAYFNAIKKERVIAADDARTDPRTKDFTEAYLIPNNIVSMMDVPIFLKDKNVGIICNEHVGKLRKWTHEEQNFVMSAANLVSMIMEISKRRITEKELENAKNDFETLTENIEEGIIVCDQSAKIIYTNTCAENYIGSPDFILLGSHFKHNLGDNLKYQISITDRNAKRTKANVQIKQILWKEKTAFLVAISPVSPSK